MYTQCPDCSTAFRVTADVLKQAAGKVRCGGCGNAFNALEYLSESMPQQPAPRESDAALPELTPEPSEKPDGLPESISAEQSAALLKTLDELAGSDIRIEDTGVEWRVLDDDEAGEVASNPVANEANAEAVPANDLQADDLVAQASEIDEILEDSPTPIDQFLTDTPPQVDSPEIFEDVDDEPARTPVDELRFDDNTPLPDDFDLDDESLFAPAPIDEPEELPEETAEDLDAASPADFDLSEPDEWTDILGEFEDLAGAVAEPEVAVAPLAAELDLLDQSGENEDEPEEPEQVVEVTAGGIDEPLDMDSQFALQAEAMGIDLSGLQESLEEPELEDDVDLELLLKSGNDEGTEIQGLLDENRVEEFADEDTQLDLIAADETEEEPAATPVDEEETEIEVAEETELDAGIELEEYDDPADEVVLEDDVEPADEVEFEEDIVLDVDIEDEGTEFDLPPLTEEEQTINMQIDQDLLALAVEDEDGFASTIIIPDGAPEPEELKKKDKKKQKKKKKAAPVLDDTSAGFETIVMEGESIRNDHDDSKREADAAAAALLAGAAAAERESEASAQTGKRSIGMIVGMVALVLVLVVQALHQSREALATNPTFNSIAGPLYRAIGMPLSPEWDITGWRFEATRHSVDEAEESDVADGSEDVVIFSRVGNNSEQSLPYPIIGISLTDRYEEPIGGFTLDPADYLPDDLDPRKLVEPGSTFDAVMTIRSPSADATSFRLRACYRNADGSLRCKDDSFK